MNDGEDIALFGHAAAEAQLHGGAVGAIREKSWLN